MIRYLEHTDIDFAKWDQCVLGAVNSRVFAMSWYLDIVAPGWDALVDENYESVFPIVHNRKFGINYLYQPFFTQQLGVFSVNLLTEERVEDFLRAIPGKFSFIQIHLNSLNKVDPEKFPVAGRKNYELDLIDPYPKLLEGYHQNTRRNLKKSGNKVFEIQRKVTPVELIGLFRRNFGEREGKLGSDHYEMLGKLMEYCLKNTLSRIIGICDPEDCLCAGVFLLETRDRIIFHFAASNERARENGAMFHLVDSIIFENAEKNLILDFEGSTDPNVARFYGGFGAKEVVYPQVTMNRLSWPLWGLVNLVRKYR